MLVRFPTQVESDYLSPDELADGVRGTPFLLENHAMSNAEIQVIGQADDNDWPVSQEDRALAAGRVMEIIRKGQSDKAVLLAVRSLISMHAQNLRLAIASDASEDRKRTIAVDLLRSRLAQIKQQSSVQGVKRVSDVPADDTKTA